MNSRLYEAKISLSDYVTNQVSEVFDNETNKFNVSSFLSGLLGGDKENDKEIFPSWKNGWMITVKRMTGCKLGEKYGFVY